MGDPGRMAADGPVRRRLSLVMAAYLVAAVVFGLLGVAGLQAVANGPVAFGVPWTVAATGTVAGVLTIALAAARARAGAARMTAATALASRGRVVILLTAVGTAVAAVVTAPVGDHELAFVLSVNAGLAVAVALFAALATHVNRVVRATLRPAVDG